MAITEFESARRNMVENQLRPSNVDDPMVLKAMGEVPREVFLPKRLRGIAYCDEGIGVDSETYLIEPLVLGRMLQTAELDPNDVVLVAGCDTGYCAAILSKLVATVFLLVPDQKSSQSIEKVLDTLGADNVVVQTGELPLGLKDQAPFNMVLLGGSVGELPDALINQLDEGGRLVAVVQSGRSGNITVAKRIGKSVGSIMPFDAAIPPIRQQKQSDNFVF